MVELELIRQHNYDLTWKAFRSIASKFLILFVPRYHMMCYIRSKIPKATNEMSLEIESTIASVNK